MKKYTALGLMSGTSMDGIDVALVISDGHKHVERGPNMFVPYDDGLRSRIGAGLQQASAIEMRDERPGNLSALESELTLRHSDAVHKFLHDNGMKSSEIDILGFHGQTVLHRPDKALTIQLGDGQTLGDATGIKVAFDMRANDMAHGGQGAPLVPAYHKALSNKLPDGLHDAQGVVFVNIGGISNVTYIPPDGDMLAFDCGPGNALIDQWIQMHTTHAYDKGGEIAASGKIDTSICDEYLSHPYFKLPVPKSLDRLDFNPLNEKNTSLADGARSLARVTALGIMKSTEHFPVSPGLWVICGGGTLNKVIMRDLRELADAANARVISAEEAGFSSMAMEAEAFAYLAIRSLNRLNLTWPMTTGCSAAVSGGVIVTPS